MRKLILFCILIASVGAFLMRPTVNADAGSSSGTDYLWIRHLISEGQKAEAQGHNPAALIRYESALVKLKNIQATDPDWEPSTVKERINFCSSKIARLNKAIVREKDNAMSSAIKGSAAAQAKTAKANTKPPVVSSKTAKSSKDNKKSVASASKAKTTPSSKSTTASKSTPKKKSTSTAAAKKKSNSSTSAAVAASKAKAPAKKKATESSTASEAAPLVRKESSKKAAPSSEVTRNENDDKIRVLANENKALRRNLEKTREQSQDLADAREKETNAFRINQPRSQSQFDKLQKELRQRERKHDELAKELRSVNDELRNASRHDDKRFESLLKENDKLKNNLDKAESRITAVTHSISNEIQTLKEELAETRQKSGGKGASRTTAKSDVSVKEIMTENALLKEELIQLEISLKESRTALAKASSASSTHEIGTNPREVAATNAQFEALLKENEGLQNVSTENTTLKERLARLEAGNTPGMAAEVASLAKQLTAAQAQLADLQKENESLKAAVLAGGPGGSSSEQLQALVAENTSLKEKLTKLESLQLPTNPQNESLQLRELNTTRSQVEDLRRENDALKIAADIQSDDERLQAVAKENVLLKEKVGKYEASIEDFYINRKEVGSVKDELAKAHATLEAMYRKDEEYRNPNRRIANHSPRDEAKAVAVANVEIPKEVPAEAPRAETPREGLPAEPVEPSPLPVASVPAPAIVEPAPTTPTPAPVIVVESGPSDATEASPSVSEVAIKEVAQIGPAASATGHSLAKLKPSTSTSRPTVVVVHAHEKFVIIDFHDREIPPAGSEFGIYHGEVLAGTVMITEPFKPPFAPANILTGTISRSDVIR